MARERVTSESNLSREATETRDTCRAGRDRRKCDDAKQDGGCDETVTSSDAFECNTTSPDAEGK